MKQQFGLIFLLLYSFNVFSQNEKDVVVYDWEIAKSASIDTVFGISFEKMKLEVLPNELSKFIHLQVLDLQKNKLTELPDFIKEFKDLRKINAEKNELAYFPIQICSFRKLTHLKLGRNYFENLPNCIGDISTLEYIDFYDTPIRELPQSLETLKNLKEIDLSGIKFSPKFQKSWIARLPNVKVIFDAPCDCMD